MPLRQHKFAVHKTTLWNTILKKESCPKGSNYRYLSRKDESEAQHDLQVPDWPFQLSQQPQPYCRCSASWCWTMDSISNLTTLPLPSFQFSFSQCSSNLATGCVLVSCNLTCLTEASRIAKRRMLQNISIRGDHCTYRQGASSWFQHFHLVVVSPLCKMPML